jgi:hypothetical protein
MYHIASYRTASQRNTMQREAEREGTFGFFAASNPAARQDDFSTFKIEKQPVQKERDAAAAEQRRAQEAGAAQEARKQAEAAAAASRREEEDRLRAQEEEKAVKATAAREAYKARRKSIVETTFSHKN